MCLKPKFKKFNWFVKLITFNWPAAITLAPFGIYINQKYYTLDNVPWETKNHESIHWPQQLQLLIIFFYAWYLIEWLIRIPINGKKAYKNIVFEREGYFNRANPNYLATRKFWGFLKYYNKAYKVT